MPHAELVAPEKYMALYRGKFQPEKSFEGVDAGEKDFRNGGYSSQPEAHAAFAAMMHVLDEQVGSIMEKLKALDLDENTVVIFSSDNGPHIEAGADPDYFDSNGILRGYKRDLYEGGIRVPFIARWPDVIEAGTVSAHVSAFWDIMPTLADLLQIKIKQKTDGISFLPTLTGKQKQQEQHEFLYWEFHELGSRRAVRQDDWKLIQYNVGKNPPGSLELYNLKADPREQNDLATDQPEVVARMKKILMREHIPSAAFRFANENK
jgi:arylsulfatase A-like enzyme